MSSYVLRDVNSNEIVNIIDWDGVSPIYTGSFIIEPLSDYTNEMGVVDLQYLSPESINIINDVAINSKIFANVAGTFTGDLTGSITINDERLDMYLNKTDYGRLTYITSSGVGIYPNDTQFIINEENDELKILMPINNISSSNKQFEMYSSSLVNLSENSLIKLNEVNGYANKQYLVLGSNIKNIGDKYIVEVTASLQNEYINNFFYTENEIDYSKLNNSTWDVDIDAGDTAHVGKFFGDAYLDTVDINNLLVTGSVDITGSLILNGVDLGELAKATERDVRYSLRWSTALPPDYYYSSRLVSYGSSNAPAGDWLFRLKMSDDQWRRSKIGTQAQATLPISLPMPMENGNPADPNFYNSTQTNPAYHDIIHNIIKNGLADSSEITFRIESKVNSQAYVVCRIDSIDAYAGFPNQSAYYKAESNWSKDQITQRSTFNLFRHGIQTSGWKSEDVSSFFDNNPSQFENDTSIADQIFVLMTVTILDMSDNEPSNLDEVWIYFDLDQINIGGDCREILIFESSTKWTPPSCLKQVTVHCIGGGGGGGGGAAGVKHKTQYFALENFRKWINYDLTQEIGHEIVFGGGGGSGGNVASKTFLASELVGSYDIIVGPGGRGANGISYEYHTTDINPTDALYPIQTTFRVESNRFRDQLFNSTRENKQEIFNSGFSKILNPLGFDRQNPNIGQYILTYPSNPNNESDLINGRHKYDGENGGNSSFIGRNISNRSILVNASGGTGGQTGTALKAYLSPYHYICAVSTNNRNTSEHAIPKGYVFGGGVKPSGNSGDRVLLGGPGGYGISMAYWEQIYKGTSRVPQEDNMYTFIPPENGYTPREEDGSNGEPLYKNTAPSLPWKNIPPILPWITAPILLGPPNPDLPGLKLPYGSTNISRQIYGLFGYYNESPIAPSYCGPTGGGGGTGKQFAASTDFDPNIDITIPPQENPADWPDDTWRGPADWATKHKLLLDTYTKKGLGGKNLIQPYLDNMPSDNTQLYLVPFGEGGNGGYDSHLHPELNTQPQDGGKYGGGGGGGAGVYGEPDGPLVFGQGGGRGGNGAVILVVDCNCTFDRINLYVEQ